MTSAGRNDVAGADAAVRGSPVFREQQRFSEALSLSEAPPPLLGSAPQWAQMGKVTRGLLVGAGVHTVVVCVLQFIALGGRTLSPRIDLELYAGCFIWAMLFELYLVVDALWGILFLQTALTGFAAYMVASTSALPIYLVIAVLILGWVVFVGALRQLIREFHWRTFYGGKPRDRVLLEQSYQALMVVMKLAFFFTSVFLVEQVFLILGFGDYETYLCIITPPIFMVVWFVLVYAVKNGKKNVLVAFAALASLGVVYFLYKVINFNVGPMYTAPDAKYGNVSKVMISQSAGYNIGLFSLLVGLSVQIYRSMNSSNLDDTDLTDVGHATRRQSRNSLIGMTDASESIGNDEGRRSVTFSSNK